MAFCHSTIKTRIHLSKSSHDYYDIIFTYYKKPYAASTNKTSIEGYRQKSPKIYALTNKGSIERYEFRPKIGRNSSKKIFDIQSTCRIKEEEIRNFPSSRFST